MCSEEFRDMQNGTLAGTIFDIRMIIIVVIICTFKLKANDFFDNFAQSWSQRDWPLL